MRAERLVTAFGETKSISAWSRDDRCQIGYKALYARLIYLRWLPELAITAPVLRLDDPIDRRGQTSQPTPAVIARDRAFANSLAARIVDVGF